MLHLTAAQSSLALLAALAICALLAIGFALLAVSAARSRRTLGADLQRVFEQLDLALQELRNQTESIERLESGVRRPALPAANTKLFDAAVRMARTGVSTDALAANSGLTKQEARLLARLHGRPDKARA